jgi:hypothetical protein
MDLFLPIFIAIVHKVIVVVWLQFQTIPASLTCGSEQLNLTNA